MAKKITDFIDVINNDLEDLHRAGTDGTIVETSYRRTRLAEEMFNYEDNINLPDGFETFKREWEEAPILEIEARPVISPEGVRNYLYQFAINRGGLFEATSTSRCKNPLLTCGTGDSACPVLGDKVVASQTVLASVDLIQESYNFKQCLNELFNYKEQDLYYQLFNKQLGLSDGDFKTLADKVINSVPSAIERSKTFRELIEHYADNGVVGKIETAVTISTSPVRLVVSDNSLLFFHKDYVVTRPNPAQAGVDECDIPQCYREKQIIGVVQVASVPNPSLGTVSFTVAKDLVTGLPLPDVTVQAGDLLEAQSGEVYSYAAGFAAGGPYTQFEPMAGIAAGQLEGYTTPGRCCNMNGFWGTFTEWYKQENNLGDGTYMGMDTGGMFGNILSPKVITTCCGDPATQAMMDVESLLSLAERSISIYKEAKRSSFGTDMFPNPDFVIQAGPNTMRAIAKATIDAYPSVGASKQVVFKDDGTLKIIADPYRMASIDLGNQFGAPVRLETVRMGMPEGVIRIGMAKPYVTVVGVHAGGPQAHYNYGNLVKQLPAGLTGIPMTLQDMERMKAQSVYGFDRGCDPETLEIQYRSSRYLNRFNPLIGVETLIMDAHFFRPGDCGPECKAPVCASC